MPCTLSTVFPYATMPCTLPSPAQCSHMPHLTLHSQFFMPHTIFSMLSTPFPFSPSHILYPYSVSFNTCFLCIPFSVCSVLPSFHPLYVLFPHSPCVVYTLLSICHAAAAMLSPAFHPLIHAPKLRSACSTLSCSPHPHPHPQ